MSNEKLNRLTKKITIILMILVAATGLSLPAFAQTASNVQSTAIVVQQDVDLRQEVFALLSDMSNVRNGETWTRWNNQWDNVVRVQYGSNGTDTFAFGQVVEVPKSPADWAYVDWEDVPYPARPSVALSHACGIMHGRVYADGSLHWDATDDLYRYEAANIAARTIELMFEVILSGASYSRPGCPLALGEFYGDPQMFKDLLERQASRHDEVVAELQDAIRRLEARPDLSPEIRNLISQDLNLRIDFQTEISNLVRDMDARWDELKDQVGSLWLVVADYQVKLDDLKQEVIGEVLDLLRERDARLANEYESLRHEWDEFNSLYSEARGDYVTHAELDVTLEGYVTRPEFEADQQRQDDEIAALWAAIHAIIDSGRGSISITGDIGDGNPLANADCGLWFSATDSSQREVTFASHSSYRGDMSVQFGRYADVQIVSYQFPNGWNTGQETSQPGTKETRWYASAPSTSSTLRATASYGGATCTVEWNVYHR